VPLDPQVQIILQQETERGLPPYNELSPLEARQQMLSLSPPVDPELSVRKVDDLRISGPLNEIPIRLYYPEGTSPYPVIVYFHGGGWVIGNLETHNAICHALAKTSGCLVAAVDYRLAPEHRYPAAIEDAYAATSWICKNAGRIQADPLRMAVMGESAGGALATVVSMMARDQDDRRIALQVLVYPVTDNNFNTSSYLNYGEGYSLTRDLMIWFWNHYLGNKENAGQPYASPLRAENLSNLPDALILTAEYDPLCDEGESYAKKLQESGVNVTLTRYDGMIHGFFRMTSKLDKAKGALTQVTDEIKRIF